MSKLIAIDDGHGINTAGKRSPILPNGQKSELGRNYMNENLFNRAVAKYLEIELKRCGFRTLQVAPTDADTSLKDRVAAANRAKADLYVSIHANAAYGKWGNHGGIETFVYPVGESKRIGTIIHNHMLNGTKLRDRGVKNGQHLYVINSTNMPAVLVEAGFMDSNTDYIHLLKDSYRRETAQEIAIGICEAYKVKYVPEAPPAPPKPVAPLKPVEAPKPKPAPSKPAPKVDNAYYRVVCGSYTDRKAATAQQARLKKAGFESMLIAYTVDKTSYLRVVCGSYQVKANAEAAQAKLKKAGFDSFLAYQKL